MNGKESLYRGKNANKKLPNVSRNAWKCWRKQVVLKGSWFHWEYREGLTFYWWIWWSDIELYKQAVRVHFMPYGVRSHWAIGNLRMRKWRRKIEMVWRSSLLRRHFAMPQYLSGWVNFLKCKRKGAQKRFVSLVIADTHYLKATLLRVRVHAQG